MHMTLIVTIVEKLLATSNKFLGLFIAIALIWQTHQLHLITDSIIASGSRSTTEYAFNLLKFSYRDVGTTDEVIMLAKKWRTNNEAPYIAAIRTLCNEEPNRLKALMDAESVKTVCRIAH